MLIKKRIKNGGLEQFQCANFGTIPELKMNAMNPVESAKTLCYRVFHWNFEGYVM